MALTPFNHGLTQDEMEVNALEIAQILLARGWTLNAIAAVLGNFEEECKLNPNDPQVASGFPTAEASREAGFGLPQWDPWYRRYGEWCNARGIAITATDDNPAGQLLPQLEYLDYECTNGWNGGRTWYSNEGYSYSWSAFKASTDDPAVLAKAFYFQYERSGSGGAGRDVQAVRWFEWLGTQPVTRLPIWLLFKIRANSNRGRLYKR